MFSISNEMSAVLVYPHVFVLPVGMKPFIPSLFTLLLSWYVNKVLSKNPSFIMQYIVGSQCTSMKF